MRKRTSPAIVELVIFSVPERMTIHIRQSKYKKDRIVPLAKTMAPGLVRYLKAENPHERWLEEYRDVSRLALSCNSTQ
jgi:integrase